MINGACWLLDFHRSGFKQILFPKSGKHAIAELYFHNSSLRGYLLRKDQHN